MPQGGDTIIIFFLTMKMQQHAKNLYFQIDIHDEGLPTLCEGAKQQDFSQPIIEDQARSQIAT